MAIWVGEKIELFDKYHFKVMEVNVTKNEALLALQSTMPEEFFEFDNNGLKWQYERANDTYYGGWG